MTRCGAARQNINLLNGNGKLKRDRQKFLSLVAVVFAAATSTAAAATKIEIVTGSTPPAIVSAAVEELSRHLERMYDADCDIVRAASGEAAHVIVVGERETHAAVATITGVTWPQLSDQGIVLRGVARSDQQVVVAGGGSPVAAAWAIYELGYQLGIRYLLSGDVLPAKPPDLEFAQFDLVLEPKLRVRAWHTIDALPISAESWSLDEHVRLLRQLAKRRINRVVLTFHPWQPFVHYTFGDIKKSTATLWYGEKYPVDGDTVGKVVFNNAKEFVNPHFTGRESYEERIAAGMKLARSIIEAAEQHGMSTGILISPLEMPREFAALLPNGFVPPGKNDLVVQPGAEQSPDDDGLRRLVSTKIRAYLEAYPQIDSLYLKLPELPAWAKHGRASWKHLAARGGFSGADLGDAMRRARQASAKQTQKQKQHEETFLGGIAGLDFVLTLLDQKDLLTRRDAQTPSVTLCNSDPRLAPYFDRLLPEGVSLLHFMEYAAQAEKQIAQVADATPRTAGRSSAILQLSTRSAGVLPQDTTRHVDRVLVALERAGWSGFEARSWMIGELDRSMHHIARRSFDGTATVEKSDATLFGAMCGSGVVTRLSLGLDAISRAVDLMSTNAESFAFPAAGMGLQHLHSRQAPPPWLSEVNQLYTDAMIEMYRSNDRAHPNGRPLLRYMAKRTEFALAYLAAIEALRSAGVAAGSDDRAAAAESLGVAAESMFNAIDAMREAARDSCDKGAIAALNAYAFRPIVREWEVALQAESGN